MGLFGAAVLATTIWRPSQANFLIWVFSDFTPCAHAQSNILHINCAEKLMIRA